MTKLSNPPLLNKEKVQHMIGSSNSFVICSKAFKKKTFLKVKKQNKTPRLCDHCLNGAQEICKKKKKDRKQKFLV